MRVRSRARRYLTVYSLVRRFTCQLACCIGVLEGDRADPAGGEWEPTRNVLWVCHVSVGMFDEILFPTDGSDGAAAGLGFALDVAASRDATLHLLSVANTTRGALDTLAQDETLEERAREAVDEAAERARERGVTVVEEVERGNPYRVVCDYAASAGVDVVVMPTRGRRGLERFLLGSTTERVVRRSEVPVLTVRPNGDATAAYPFEDVLVGVDGSRCGRAALDVGVAVADQEGAALHLLSVVDVAAL